MSLCKICEKNGHPGIMIAWDNNIKTKEGRFVPLELDKKTPHKHFDAQNKLPEPNDYPNPITQDKAVSSQSEQNNAVTNEQKLDVSNLNVIRVIAAALEEYIAMKEAGK